jgi:hypothetical protein
MLTTDERRSARDTSMFLSARSDHDLMKKGDAQKRHGRQTLPARRGHNGIGFRREALDLTWDGTRTHALLP